MCMYAQFNFLYHALQPLASFVYPDAYPGKNDTVLSPDEIYNSYTRMDILYKAQMTL